MMKNSIFALSLLALVSSCATKPPVESLNDAGQWEAKAQIKDLKKGTNRVLSLDIVSQWPDKLRLEVTATLGYQVASLALKKTQVQYIVYPQKRYVEGRLKESNLQSLFSFNFNPKFLINFSFDRPIQGADWNCKFLETQLVQSCQRKDGLEVSWSERDGQKKRVTVRNQDIEVQILYKSFTTKVPKDKDLFQLTEPEGFRKYKLN